MEKHGRGEGATRFNQRELGLVWQVIKQETAGSTTAAKQLALPALRVLSLQQAQHQLVGCAAFTFHTTRESALLLLCCYSSNIRMPRKAAIALLGYESLMISFGPVEWPSRLQGRQLRWRGEGTVSDQFLFHVLGNGLL